MELLVVYSCKKHDRAVEYIPREPLDRVNVNLQMRNLNICSSSQYDGGPHLTVTHYRYHSMP